MSTTHIPTVTTTAHIQLCCPAADDNADALTWMGEIETTGLEDIFRQFNRATHEDSLRLQALGYHQPSLSMGDLIVVHRSSIRDILAPGFYITLPTGFGRITGHDYQKALDSSAYAKGLLAMAIAGKLETVA